MEAINQLWRSRCSENFRRQLRYWNLIGKNSGLMFFVYAMILAGAFYYKKWLDSLPAHFPGGLLLTLLFTLLVVPSPIRTFLQRADCVFLLPAESELNSYFVKSCLYSFAMQSLLLSVFLIISAPLYFQQSGNSETAYLIAALAIFAAKGWNIYCHWREQRIDETKPLIILRTFLSFLLLFAVLNGMRWVAYLSCAAVMLVISFLLFEKQAARGLLSWERLIAMETRQEMKFLRFANLFTDVPKLRRHVRPRIWLTRFVPARGFDRNEVYRQLFLKTFIRADDYFGIYCRLNIIGCLTVYFVSMGIWTLFLIASLVYLTGLQLLPLWRYSFPQALEGMYPVKKSYKKKAFTRLLIGLLAAESVLLSISGLLADGRFLNLLLYLISGLGVSLVFVFGYVRHLFEKEGTQRQ